MHPGYIIAIDSGGILLRGYWVAELQANCGEEEAAIDWRWGSGEGKEYKAR